MIEGKRIRPGPYDAKRKEAAMDGPNPLVWATHPDFPNKSGNARGRVIHIERPDAKFDYPATYCGMLAVEFVRPLHVRRVCIQCTKIREQAVGAGRHQ